MAKTAIILIFGALAALFGMVLQFRAGALATDWQLDGPGVWGGTTSPTVERGYQLVGLYLMAFGLALAVVAVQRWLARGVSTGNVRSAA